MKKDEKKNEVTTFSAETLANEITNSVMSTLQKVLSDLEDINPRLIRLENSTTIDHNAQNVINKHARKRIHTLLGKSTDPDYIKYGRTFRMRLWVYYRDRFGVSSYRDTRQVDFDEAVTFCDEWFPDQGVEGLKQEIDEIKRIQEEQG